MFVPIQEISLIIISRGLAATVERALKRKNKIITTFDPPPKFSGGLDKIVIVYYNSKSAPKLGAPEFLLAG